MRSHSWQYPGLELPRPWQYGWSRHLLQTSRRLLIHYLFMCFIRSEILHCVNHTTCTLQNNGSSYNRSWKFGSSFACRCDRSLYSSHHCPYNFEKGLETKDGALPAMSPSCLYQRSKSPPILPAEPPKRCGMVKSGGRTNIF